MTKTVDVYFDYVCPFSYVAFKREPLLKADLDVEFNWRPWEIHPERPIPPLERRTLTTSYIVGTLAREIKMDIKLPKHKSNSHMALLGVEIAKKMGKLGPYTSKIWQVHWKEKQDISDINVLKKVCSSIGVDPEVFEREISDPEFNSILQANDVEAEKIGVELVPSYVLGRQIVVGDISLPNLKSAIAKYLQS